MEIFKPSNINFYKTRTSTLLLVRMEFAKKGDGGQKKKKNTKEY